MTGEWQPIETIPDGCNDPVLVACPGAHRGLWSCEVVVACRSDFGVIDYWTNGGPNGGSDLYFDPGEEPTHWMPLPEPPR